VSAPTLWEEGRWSGSRVTRFSIFACTVLVLANLIISNDLDKLFDAGFVLLCICAALAIRPTEFFTVGVLPPMLLLGFCMVLGVVKRTAIAPSDDGWIQAVISGLAHHSGSLLVGYVLALGVLAVRARVLRRIAEEEIDQPRHYSNRDASPAPYRVTSGEPEVKSTTVVGNDPHSPESITTSST
jgi:hypothetical protein